MCKFAQAKVTKVAKIDKREKMKRGNRQQGDGENTVFCLTVWPAFRIML